MLGVIQKEAGFSRAMVLRGDGRKMWSSLAVGRTATYGASLDVRGSESTLGAITRRKEGPGIALIG